MHGIYISFANEGIQVKNNSALLSGPNINALLLLTTCNITNFWLLKPPILKNHLDLKTESKLF